MEHDSSRSGYYQPQPASTGHDARSYTSDVDLDWEEDDIEASTHSVKPRINLIWAQGFDLEGHEGAIGADGSMPWHLREDMKYFKDRTITHPVIMGRKTWESLSEKFRPLSNRDNYVVSHQHDFRADGAMVVNSLETAIELASQPAIPDDGVRRDEVWIIGGAQIYQAALPFADEIYITDVDCQVDADAYAPQVRSAVESGLWVEEIVQDWTKPQDSASPIARYRFRVLKRAE